MTSPFPAVAHAFVTARANAHANALAFANAFVTERTLP